MFDEEARKALESVVLVSTKVSTARNQMIDSREMFVTVPRIVIAAPASGSGKSTIATGLMAAFSQRGSVQGFKVGPDYIDPMYHTAAAGRISRNLDTWMTPLDYVRAAFARASADADLAIIEGVMGLFDGYGGEDDSGSTAEVAKLLKAPVILVLDVGKMARSAGALALGYRDFDPELNVAGVICNNVASDGHAQWVTAAIESIGLPVLGCLPRSRELHIPERHLGLHTAVERQLAVEEFLQQADRLVTEHIDLEKLLDSAKSAEPYQLRIERSHASIDSSLRIAVARDEAFCFYYEDNLDLLREAGAEINFFSPLHDEALPPDTSGIYLGGGYPELYADALAQNQTLAEEVRQAHTDNMPIYAECGGLMVLTQSLTDLDGKQHSMFGLIPGHSQMQERLTMGYRLVTAPGDTPLLKSGEQARGHEFHYSDWLDRPEDITQAYDISPRIKGQVRPEGYSRGNLLASYTHLHFGSNPAIAHNFIQICAKCSTLPEPI